ncbi:ABC transporter ATP-binding protein [Mesorhizobium sp. VNQ89]|uniref:ABC transporter ATP-binding protein n=1 Tax=Mesorhizobium quangtriensis TaxID=3157709 RepID=UPI0032B7AC3C
MNTDQSAYLSIRNVSKRYGDVTALSDCSLSIAKGELIALLGPSGCGKSTLLSLIGGLQYPDTGSIELDGRSLVDIPMNRRQVGIVFQSYALFPHMTVRENVAYGLKVRREHPEVIAERSAEVLSLLKLEPFVDRYPSELSGGQQQRVAVARALAIRPVLMLLDEALSALDKNLREEMQIELALLLRNAGITTILVTHDQREAFTFGDRIAIMNHGVIHQVGPPEEVYRKPETAFVLDFLGSVTSFPARLERRHGGGLVAVSETGIVCSTSGAGNAGDAVRIYLRSDDISLSTAPTAVHSTHPGTVALVTFLGSVKRHVINLGGVQVLADLPAQPGSSTEARHEPVYLEFAPDHAYVLPESRR